MIIQKPVRYKFNIQKKTLIELYLNPTTDGVIFGIVDKKLGDVHLIILYKDGKVGYHISDKTTEKNYPLDQHFYPEIFFHKVQKKLKRMIKSYHGNKKVFIMKGKLKKEVDNQLDKYFKNPEEVSLEFVYGRFECDFENTKRWKKFKIRELFKEKYRIGFILKNNAVKCVIPLNENIMLIFSERQYDNLVNLATDYFGFDKYLDYVKEEKGFKPDFPKFDKK